MADRDRTFPYSFIRPTRMCCSTQSPLFFPPWSNAPLSEVPRKPEDVLGSPQSLCAFPGGASEALWMRHVAVPPGFSLDTPDPALQRDDRREPQGGTSPLQRLEMAGTHEDVLEPSRFG